MITCLRAFLLPRNLNPDFTREYYIKCTYLYYITLLLSYQLTHEVGFGSDRMLHKCYSTTKLKKIQLLNGLSTIDRTLDANQNIANHYMMAKK